MALQKHLMFFAHAYQRDILQRYVIVSSTYLRYPNSIDEYRLVIR